MEKEIKYPKCGNDKKVKRGFALGKQRYMCKNCGCNYTRSEKRVAQKKKNKKRLDILYKRN